MCNVSDSFAQILLSFKSFKNINQKKETLQKKKQNTINGICVKFKKIESMIYFLMLKIYFIQNDISRNNRINTVIGIIGSQSLFIYFYGFLLQ